MEDKELKKLDEKAKKIVFLITQLFDMQNVSLIEGVGAILLIMAGFYKEELINDQTLLEIPKMAGKKEE